VTAAAVDLTFDQLALIYKSLQAVKTLGALGPEDELLEDTLQLLDVVLNRVVQEGSRLSAA
jgi:hypothetical protein